MRMIFPSCLGQFAPGISTIVTVCTDPLASDKLNRTLTSVYAVLSADKWFL